MRYVYKKPLVRAAMSLYDRVGGLFLKRKPPKEATPPKRICFIVLHQIGDVVMSLPTIQAVRQAFPEAACSAILSSVTAPLVRATLAGVDVREFDAHWQATVRHTLGEDTPGQNARAVFVALLHELSPEVAIVFHADLEVNRLLGKSPISYTFGFANAGGGFWLTNGMSLAEAGHQVDRNFALARAVGRTFGREVGQPGRPALSVEADARARIRELIGAETPLAAIHPFGRFPARDWNDEGWSQAIAWLDGRGYQVAVLGGPRDEASRYLSMGSDLIDLTGALSLPETAALLAESDLFIGIDSGPGHIAAAVGCPVVSIFSAANVPSRWAPFADQARVRVLHTDVADRRRLPLEAKDVPAGYVVNPYSQSITAEMVIGAAEDLIEASSKKPELL